MTRFTRRSFLIAGAIKGTCIYAYQRGLRYPRLSLETGRPTQRIKTSNAGLELSDAIVTCLKRQINLRAIAPEPAIDIKLQKGKLKFSLNNVAKNATLIIEGQGIKSVDEQTNGITRTVAIESTTTQRLKLRWHLPVEDGLDFALLGDTGGGDELTWGLTKAHQLGAQFLLHLGDFNYGNNEYDLAINAFKESPIPVYVSIGNHDFNDDGLIFQRFLDEIGPMNHAFELAGTQFINIDTAADFLPVGGGNRGDLFASLNDDQNDYSDRLFFSHRPLKDPRPHDDHDAGQPNEIDWLANAIAELGANTLVTGHVHHSSELDYKGIHQWTVGEGLGHEDIIQQKQVAKILLGRVEPGKKVAYRWADLGMPWASHTSYTHEKKLRIASRKRQLEWFNQLAKT